MSDRILLRVVEGRQRGVRVPLEPGAELVLGRALDADIVLREPGLAARAISLRPDPDPEAGRVALECLAGDVAIDGEALAAGAVATLGLGASVALGALVLTIETDVAEATGVDDGLDASALDGPTALAGDPAFAATPEGDAFELDPFDMDVDAGLRAIGVDGAPAGGASADGDADGGGGATIPGTVPGTTPETGPDEAGPVETGEKVAAKPRRSPLVTFGAIAATFCVALAGWLWHAGDGAAEGPSLDARLEAAFPALALERRANGGLVRGFVADRGESIRLERWLAAQPERTRSAVLVDTELAERVETVLRISEVEGAVRSLAAGAAVVDVSVADAEELARVEARVREDVPQLVALTLENTPPPPVERAGPVDPGKRVELVVATEPAYVVTRDRSRYFVGSLLPSGHRIAAIEEGTLHLEKGDVVTELKF